MMHNKLISLILFAGLAAAAGADDSEREAHWSRSVELNSGHTAEIDGRATADDNAAARREVTISNPDGEVVYQGVNGAARGADGQKARARRGTWTDAAGNTVETGRRAAADGDGNQVRQRTGRVTDEAGTVIRAGRDSGINRADGDKARSQRRLRVDDEGNTIRKGRQKKTDGQGNTAGRRGKTVTDADGETVRKRRERGVRANQRRTRG